jgi:hypothetical protein
MRQLLVSQYLIRSYVFTSLVPVRLLPLVMCVQLVPKSAPYSVQVVPEWVQPSPCALNF